MHLLLVPLVLLSGLTAPDSLPAYSATTKTVTAADLGATWHSGCPVGPAQLRMISLTYYGMDQKAHAGQLVVNTDRVDQTIKIFGELYRMRYPIAKMVTPDHYPNADDELSMEDNNTSAYDCRDIPTSGALSYHAYGRAIDINTLINPYHDSQGVQPKNGGPYLDRTRKDPGMLHDGDKAVRAFTGNGWTWGGDWHTLKDYQHFELA
ncbi:M15 family metallopeptidase [Fodinicola feengrottensis]|uniref:M15 family metallopeptidase n=1 Tax=Fodinicola feengrottensis TaxID=435914 RepID=A0ABP4SYJ7_9ACTN